MEGLLTQPTLSLWERFIITFLRDGKVSLDDLTCCQKELEDYLRADAFDFDVFLSLFSMLAICSYDELPSLNSLETFYRFMQENGLNFPSSTYRYTYPLISHFLGKKPSFTSLMHPIFKMEQDDLYKESYNLMISLFIALRRKDRDFLTTTLALILEHKKKIPSNETIFPGVWINERVFNLEITFFIQDVLTSFLEVYSDSSGLDLKKKSRNFRPDSFFGLLALCIGSLVSKMMKESMIDINKTLLVERQKNQTKNFCFYQKEDFSCICRVTQFSSGFIGVKKEDIEILSIGPQLGPIGDMSLFGCHRTRFSDHNGYADVKIHETESGLFFNSWMRLPSSNDQFLGHTWMNLEAVAEKKELFVNLKWVDYFEKPELSLLFFIKAEKAIVDKIFYLHPDTLDRYEGKAADLCFVNGVKSLSISTSLESSMKVIPLSGGQHFWGAKFLVAYNIGSCSAFTFRIA